MNDEPKGFPTVGVLLAHVVCCGGIMLVATGALSGIGAWFFEGGLAWLVGAALVAAAGLVLWRGRRPKARVAPLEPPAPETPTRRSRAA